MLTFILIEIQLTKKSLWLNRSIDMHVFDRFQIQFDNQVS